MKKTGNEKFKIFLSDFEVKQFKLFVKDFKLTNPEIAELENEGRDSKTILHRLRKEKEIRRSFVRKVVKAKLEKSEQYIEKYKPFLENL